MSTADALAAATVAPIESGMVVGLGTGRAAARAIRALGERARTQGLKVTCAATSIASAELAASLGLRVVPASEAPPIDYLFDGADEADPRFRMIKGAGGAMTRERILARAARRCVYILQTAKCSEVLGTRAALPIEVLAFGLSATQRALARLGAEGPLRQKDGALYLTDNGHPVIDAVYPRGTDPAELADALDRTAGIIDHGLFISEAHEFLIEDQTGAVRRLVR